MTNRAGEPGNPAYVISVDNGGPQDGTEVAKPGSAVHARAPDDTFAAVGAASTRPAIDAEARGKPAAVPHAAEVEASQAVKEEVEALGDEAMAADEAAAAGKAEEAALLARLEGADAAAEGEGKPQGAAVTRADTAEAAEGGERTAEADGDEALKRKPLDAPITRADAAKVAKLGGACAAAHAGPVLCAVMRAVCCDAAPSAVWIVGCESRSAGGTHAEAIQLSQ